MNILKLQDQLKGLPDNALVGYVQNPTGQVPTYLALSELQRRKDMRSKHQAAETTPQQSVADELVAEATQPPPGLAGLPQAAPMMEAMAPPPEMPVQEMAQGGLADLDVGNMFNERSYANGGIVAFDDGGEVDHYAQGGEVQHFVEGGTSKLGRWWEGYKQRSQESLAIEDEIQRLQNEYYSLTVDPLKKTLPGQPEAAAQKQAEIKQRINELRAAKSGAVSNAPSTPPGPNVMGSQAAADKMFGTQYDPSQSIGYKGAPAKEAPSAAIGGAYNNEKVQSIGDYAKELQDYLGPDKNLALQKERLAKMEGRATRMEQQAPWLALAEAGFGMAAGTSPFALTNIGAGAQMGLKSYGAAQDKLAMLEEKRMVIAMNMDQAERREKLAVAEFGAKSKEAAQERNFKRQLQREHDATLKQMNTDDNLKALQAAMIKNQPTITESLKVKEWVDANLPKEEKLILEGPNGLGKNSSDPESKNFSAYLDRMEKAKLKLEREAIRRPGIPEVTGSPVTTSRAKFLGFE
jgi:hypothetical protein